jgi:hypothetical protein
MSEEAKEILTLLGEAIAAAIIVASPFWVGLLTCGAGITCR